MKQIAIGHGADGPLKLDIQRLIVSRLLVTADSGGGKSYLLRKILEEISETTQTIVIDPEGEFASLRELRDMVLVGPGGEVPADPRSAGLLARRLMEMNLSAVIDMSELTPRQRQAYAKMFCETLVALPRTLWHNCLIVFDEAHEFAPEEEKSESENSLAELSVKGRKRGYCLACATQRLSKLSKNVAAGLKNQFLGTFSLDADIKRAAAFLGFGKDRHAEIRDLSSQEGHEGEFFCVGPALNHRGVTKMRAAKISTSHPKPGQGRSTTPPAPSKKILGVLQELSDIPQQAEEEIRSLADAKKKITELERQVKAKPVVAAADPAVIDRAIASALAQRDREWQATVKDRERVIGDFKGRLGKIAGLAHVNGEAAPKVDAPAKALVTAQAASHVLPARTQHIPKMPRVDSRSESGDLGKAERAILGAFYWLRGETITPAKVGFYANYSAQSGGFNNALSRLRTLGLLQGWTITESGEREAESLGAGPKPGGSELREWLRRKLGKAENAILDALTAAYPERLSADALGDASGYSANSGGFNNALSRLRSIEAAEGGSRDGGTKASDVFFE